MKEFLKERKVVLIVVLLGIGVFGWKIYNSINFNMVDSNDILISSNTVNTLEKNNENTNDEIIVVHITGEVKRPGVVRIKEGSRIEDIIEAAGGLTENADISNVNLAYIVEDGVKIRIPDSSDEALSKNYITDESGEDVIISDGEAREQSNDEPSSITVVNINKATQTELETLPGIGPSIASRIIDYRTQNGKFKSVEDIKSVTGIGDSKFEKIKEFIKVK